MSESSRRPTATSGLWVTVGAWLTARFVVGMSYRPARNPFRLEPAAWGRWDSFHYVDIAVHGRTFGRCDSPRFSALPNPLNTTWCGTAGWLPGYPWMIRALSATG